jgi:thioredoxin 1
MSLSDDDFQQTISSSRFTVVDFWNGGCMPCRVMLPVMDELAKRHPDVLFCEVNTNKSVKLATELNVLMVPTFVLFRDGKRVARISGAKPIEIFEEELQRYFFSQGTQEPGPYEDKE